MNNRNGAVISPHCFKLSFELNHQHLHQTIHNRMPNIAKVTMLKATN